MNLLRRLRPTALIAGLLCAYLALTPTQSRSAQAITNQDVIEMVVAKVPDSSIIITVRGRTSNFDTSPNELIKLTKAGASEAVINAIIQASLSPSSEPSSGVASSSSALSSQRITSESSFYVMLPANGTYGGREYPQSGTMTAQAVVSALSTHGTKVLLGPTIQEIDAALMKARQENATHVFQPTILNWEDRATEWSGRRDRITIKFAVYEVQTRKLISSTVVSANGRFWTFGGIHPQDLLPGPTQKFVDELFR